jgi:hypothetical protein
MLCEGGGGIKYFPPARDDNTWKELGVRLHAGECKEVEMDTGGLNMGWTQTPSPILTPKRETCVAFLEKGEKESST